MAMDEVAEEEQFAEFSLARPVHEIIGSADPTYETFRLMKQQQMSVEEFVQLRAGLSHAGRQAKPEEHELTQTRSMLQDALKRAGQRDNLPELCLSELMAEYRTESRSPYVRSSMDSPQDKTVGYFATGWL